MPKLPPFLNLNARIDYLYDREYFTAGAFKDEHRERLASMNFHYFLGYARNYRMLVGRGLIGRESKSPDDVFSIIERDHAVSELLYTGVRQAEWNLRHLAVKHYCSRFDGYGTFFDSTQYLDSSAELTGQVMVERIADHVLRYGEPYVEGHIKTAARSKALESDRNAVFRPERFDNNRAAECIDLIRGLPLWSVVDGFSLGLLSRFITQCDRNADVIQRVWREIAADLDIANSIFQTNIQALTVLRNAVAHNSRLWMRPTTNSPAFPNAYKRRLRGVHNKSMMVGFINVAMFQGKARRDAFVQRIDDLITADPIYFYGVTQVHHPTEADRNSMPPAPGAR